ncbi:MAG: SRPBCC family protein [Deltaproteobacteria bacterium]|nr:SRPBCC family protein [Deltaproteobacteria bacterium]
MPRVLKLVGLGLGALLLAFTVLGLVLPRDLRIKRSVELPAPLAAVSAEVDDLSRWPGWAFGPEARECTFHGARAEGLRWTCGEVEGALVRTDRSPGGTWIDAQVGGQVDRVRMKIALTELATGTLLVWEEQATAPRVMGAWLRPWLEGARSAEIDRALVRLREHLTPATPGAP